MPIEDGRQVGHRLADIRDDHVRRYEWAARFIADHTPTAPGEPVRILDIGCGVGYGSRVLYDRVPKAVVIGVDASAEAIAYGDRWFPLPSVSHRVTGDLTHLDTWLWLARLPPFDAVVAFEFIEHVEDAPELLARVRKLKPTWFLGSVPNQSVVPFNKERNPYHFRHYTPDQLRDLLTIADFDVPVLNGQYGKKGSDADVGSAMAPTARTMVFAARPK